MAWSMDGWVLKHKFGMAQALRKLSKGVLRENKSGHEFFELLLLMLLCGR